MAQLNYQQVQDLWIRNGGDPGWAPLMAGIAYAESGWQTDALNPNSNTLDYSVGLWQINYYGNLREPRTARYGSPEQLAADPNRQAIAAVDLFGDNGAGLGNWTNDATWVKWVQAGRPQKPSADTVQQWINAPNLPAGAIVAGQSSGSFNAGATGGCSAGSSGVDIPFAGKVGTKCQLKALTGGLLVAGGVSLMVTGVILVAMQTNVGKSVAGVASNVVPGGSAIRSLGRSGNRFPRVTAETRQKSRADFDARNPSPARQEATRKARSGNLGVMGYSMDDLASDLFRFE